MNQQAAIPFERLEGKYEILEKMREGGMGAVYKVRHRLLDEIRVIKMMRPQLAGDDVLRARFLREAKTAIRLRHDNLVQIYDFTIDEDGTFFLVMEFVDGPDLRDLMTAVETLSIGLVLEIARQTLGVLGYLHRKEIVHRDISPDNLLLCRDDDGMPLVKLIDLGIAKVQKSEEQLTATGTFLGKVRYSSPEHFRTKDSAAVGPRSDLYSFGVVLYELLTGKYPIKGASISSLIAGHLMHEPLSFEDSDPDNRVPEALRAVVERALEKDPEKRFPSARAFRTKIGDQCSDFSFESEEVERVFSLARQARSEREELTSGGAQGRLDRNFEPATTPARGHGSSTPSPSAGPVTPQTPHRGAQLEATEIQPEVSGAPNQQVTALVLGAEKLLKGKHFHEARLQLRAALDLDPEHADAIELMDVLDASDPAIAAQREANRRAVEIESTVATIRDHLVVDDLSGARRALDLARKLYGGEEQFDEIEGEVSALADALHQRRAEQFSDEAAQLVGVEDYGAAIIAAEEALKIVPDLESATTLLAEARAGIETQERARKRQAAIEEASDGVRRLVAAGRLDAAIRWIETARTELGDFPEAADLNAAIDEENERRNSCDAAVRRLLQSAIGATDQEDFERANADLQEAADLATDHAELVDEVEAAVERAGRLAERHRRSKALAEAVASIQKRLEHGATQEAERELEVAERLFGREPVFTSLKIALVKLERSRHEAAVEKLLAEALGTERSFSEAITRLEKAQTLAPGNDKVQRLLAETRAAQIHYERERRAELVAEAMADVDGLIAADRLEAAIEALQRVVQRHGDFSEAKSLRTRLGKMRGGTGESHEG